MHESFHDGTGVDKDALHALMDRKDRPGLLLFGAQYSLFLGAAAFVVVCAEQPWCRWYYLLPALLLFGLMSMALFAVVHETSHNTAFRSRKLNEIVLWLAAVPILYTPTGFRQFHWDHHRYTNDPEKDPEISLGGKPSPAFTSNFVIYAGFISGVPLLMAKLGFVIGGALGGPQIVWNTLLSFVNEKYRSEMKRDARLVLLFLAAWITAGVLWLPGLLYLFLGLLAGHAMLSFYLVAEHSGLPHSGDIFDRTRTTFTLAPLRLMMWNMPYHAEHHAYPAVPWHALPKLHAHLQAQIKRTSDGYVPLHGEVLHQLLRGKSFEDVVSE